MMMMKMNKKKMMMVLMNKLVFAFSYPPAWSKPKIKNQNPINENSTDPINLTKQPYILVKAMRQREK
jgi:hypothetical protein